MLAPPLQVRPSCPRALTRGRPLSAGADKPLGEPLSGMPRPWEPRSLSPWPLQESPAPQVNPAPPPQIQANYSYKIHLLRLVLHSSDKLSRKIPTMSHP